MTWFTLRKVCLQDAWHTKQFLTEYNPLKLANSWSTNMCFCQYTNCNEMRTRALTSEQIYSLTEHHNGTTGVGFRHATTQQHRPARELWKTKEHAKIWLKQHCLEPTGDSSLFQLCRSVHTVVVLIYIENSFAQCLHSSKTYHQNGWPVNMQDANS